MKKNAALFASAFAAVLTVFSFAPPAAFLRWDDAANLLDNHRWRGLSWEHLKWMWGTRHYGPWQPLSWLSWAVDRALWGLDPAAFRRTNVVLHAATAGFAALAFRRLFPRAPLAAALGAALFFGLHPLRVESVIWITERRDVLSGVFSIASLWLWIEDRRRLSLLTFTGAVLSKGTAIAVMPFLFVIDVSVKGVSARDSVRRLVPFSVPAVLAAAMNLRGFGTGDLHGLDLPILDRVLVALSGAWFYLAKTLFPAGLSPYYALPLDAGAIARAALPGAVLALAVTGACFHPKARRWAPAAWLAFLAALAPVSGLLQNGRQSAADRYSYLACLPFAVLFGLALARLKPRAAAAAACAVALLLAAVSIRQSSYWRDDVSLWTRAAAVQPEAYLPRSNLAAALLSAGRGQEAVPHLEAAIRLEPRDAEARVNLGSVLSSRGDLDGAERMFREALALRSGSAPAATNLAGLRARRGDLQGAIRDLEEVVARNPSFAPAHFNLGALLIRAGRKSDGLARLREAARLDPSLAAVRRVSYR